MMTRTGFKYSFYTAALALLIVPYALTATADQQGDGWQKGDREAFREEMRARIQDRIDAMDTDGNGKISFDEFHAPDKDPFTQFDQDGDGSLNLDEMKESMAQKAHKKLERRFAKMDKDGNGVVTRDEMRRQMFDRMDRDGDGFLTGREFRPGGPGGHRHGRHGGGGL